VPEAVLVVAVAEQPRPAVAVVERPRLVAVAVVPPAEPELVLPPFSPSRRRRYLLPK